MGFDYIIKCIILGNYIYMMQNHLIGYCIRRNYYPLLLVYLFHSFIIFATFLFYRDK